MLNINNFTLFKNTNFKPQVKNAAFTSYPKFNATNLAPLAHDTVSFGAKSIINVTGNDKVYEEIYENAKPVHDKMVGLIQSHFNNLIYDPEDNPNGVINPIDKRIKTPESIKEKVVSKIQKAFDRTDEFGKHTLSGMFAPDDIPSIKDNLRDISGTQITIRDASKETTDKIIDSLCEMIKKNNLVINEIQNHTSGNDDSASYFSKEQLEKLREVVNEQNRENGEKEIGEIIPEPKESGYTGLHISFDTTAMSGKDKSLKKNFGYYHEMQIIGADVEILKDVENFCYKLKKGLDIMQGHYAYAPFVEYFLKKYPKKEDDSPKDNALREAYLEYTKKAYEIQRNRVPNYSKVEDDVTNWAYKYPTIEECGFKGVIPVELDFNNLARIKRDCDDIYKVANNAEKILNGKELEIDKKGKILYDKTLQKDSDSKQENANTPQEQ